MNSGSGSGCLVAIACAVFFMILIAIVGGASSNSSSYSPSYSKRDAYDAKYGKGSYDADKALLDSMRDAYNSATGK